MARLVLTFVGDDRPGLVNAISAEVAAHEGSWLESRSVRLAGKFAGVLLVAIDDEKVIALESELAKLLPKGLRVSVERGEGTEIVDIDRKTVSLDVVGQDRPGIVRDVTQALNALGVNIEEFASGLENAPFTGETIFRATARLVTPQDIALEDIRKALERLAGEIMVDLTISDRGTT